MTACHAPRERVSWNDHMEELADILNESRSTWACELKWNLVLNYSPVQRSRSTWACELKWIESSYAKGERGHAPRERVSWNVLSISFDKVSLKSRSTWACELKYFLHFLFFPLSCHAPRERVSWNAVLVTLDNEVIESRSTWACELKSKICLPMSTTFSSRSTWACELKSWHGKECSPCGCHAPRERVSWNPQNCPRR